ncbi:MAG: mannose-phosphate guanylyltransferase/mannose-6-phosphate isomerase [Pseudomonadota bacterium]
MSGGSGTRLWPASRKDYPKQFLCLGSTHTLLQETVLRLGGQNGHPMVVVGNAEHRFLISDQLQEIGAGQQGTPIILEPSGKNTAPAVTLGALAAMASGEDPILVVSPTDHSVGNPAAFTMAVRQAMAAASNGAIVTLGIQPTRAETGYGYIHANRAQPKGTAFPVNAFVEKPNAEKATAYVDSGDYYWNGGLFVMRASVWLAALESFRPDIHTAVLDAWSKRSIDAVGNNQFVRPDTGIWSDVPSESVDYAVMEKLPGSKFELLVVPLDAQWTDLGAWDAVWDHHHKDATGNATLGDVKLIDAHNNLVQAENRMVGVIGLDDIVVVETADAVLVAAKSKTQQVKDIVAQLGNEKRTEGSTHRKVHRPWGWYDSVDSGDRHQVKRIMVKPGAKLSLQMHHHRAEHWIVVRGTAEVTCNDKVIMLTENQSTYIPLGAVHRLSNPGKVPLEIIEVQSGGYLGEDDIVRIEDTYGRSA